MTARFSLLVLFAAAVIGGAVGGGAALWTAQKAHDRPTNLHDVVHRKIRLTPQEHARLEAAEARYEAERVRIENRIAAANGRLAALIMADPRYSSDVEAMSAETEAAAAELQRNTLVHIFEMRQALDPDHQAAYDAVLIEALTRRAR